MTKKQRLCAGIAAAAGAAAIGSGAFFLTHTYAAGIFLPKNAAVYDLSDRAISAEAYKAICSRFPDAQVIWQVPFQGARYPADTAEITLSSLTAAEAEALDALPDLQTIHAETCTDYAALAYLQTRRPDCRVRYAVPVGGEICGSQADTLTLADADPAVLREALPLLPKLRSLVLQGKLPATRDLLALRAEFPDLAIWCSLELWGAQLETDAVRLDLSQGDVTAAALADVLPLFSDLQELDLTESKLTDAERKALIRQFPEQND